jgi:nucleoid-associated protein EbfC
MAGMDEILKQANEMQKKMTQMQSEVESMQTIGEAGGGLLKVIVNGNRRINRVFIDPRLFAEDESEGEGEGEGEGGDNAVQKTLLQANMSATDKKNMFEELIASAVNDGTEKIEREIQEKIAEMTKDIQLPPGFDMGGDAAGSITEE